MVLWMRVMAEFGEEELALSKIEALEAELRDFQPFHAAYASLLARLGDRDRARSTYDTAIRLAVSRSHRRFLEGKRDELAET